MQNESFRIGGKHFFLTYPRCPIPKEVAFSDLRDRLHPDKLLVAAEKHDDGSDHLHAYLYFLSKRDFKNSRFADLRHLGQDYHGNYQSCRSPKAVMKYAIKDGDYVSNFDISKVNVKKWAADQIVLKKRPLHELVEEEPDLIFGYSRLVADVNSFLSDQKTKTCLDLPPFLPNPWSLVLPSKRVAKRRHYWLYSTQPNVGKSFHFAKPLQEEYGAVIQTGDFSYWNVSIGVRCLILDEYNTARLRFDALNSMCDGTFGYRVFQRGVVRLDQPLIIILSNSCIQDLYPFKYELLHARFFEKKLD